jgi:hypothetical protein
VMFASMRFLIFLFCFLTFFFHLPVFSFHSFLLRWIIMMHTHTSTGKLFFLLAGIKVSLIVHQQGACVFTALAVEVNYLVYVHTVSALSFVVVN